MKPFDYPITVDGKEYILRYSFKTRREFERKHKKSVAGLLQKIANPDTQTADDVIDLTMLLLASHHPDMTAEQVENMIDSVGEAEIIPSVVKAISGDTEEEKK